MGSDKKCYIHAITICSNLKCMPYFKDAHYFYINLSEIGIVLQSLSVRQNSRFSCRCWHENISLLFLMAQLDTEDLNVLNHNLRDSWGVNMSPSCCWQALLWHILVRSRKGQHENLLNMCQGLGRIPWNNHRALF